jgi:hypothetical protein
MANPKDLPDQLQYIPLWRKGDPGPDWPWILRELSAEVQIQLVVSQLQYEGEVAAAAAKAIQRNITIVSAAKKQ